MKADIPSHPCKHFSNPRQNAIRLQIRSTFDLKLKSFSRKKDSKIIDSQTRITIMTHPLLLITTAIINKISNLHSYLFIFLFILVKPINLFEIVSSGWLPVSHSTVNVVLALGSWRYINAVGASTTIRVALHNFNYSWLQIGIHFGLQFDC